MTPDNLAAQAAHTLLLSAHDPERALAMLLTRLERHPETATDRAMADMARAALDVRRAAQQQSARFMAKVRADHEARTIAERARDVAKREQELRDQVAAAQASLERALMEQAKAQEHANAERARADAMAELARQAADPSRLRAMGDDIRAAARKHGLPVRELPAVPLQPEDCGLPTAQDAQEARAAWGEARTDAHYP